MKEGDVVVRGGMREKFAKERETERGGGGYCEKADIEQYRG